MSADQMMKSEIAKRGRKPRKLVIAAAAVGVAILVAGGVVGANAANSYRAEIDAAKADAAEYYELAAEQQQLAQQAADEAQESAEAAAEAASAAEAAEAAAAAQAAADAAAAAAAAAQPSSGGLLPSGAPIPTHLDTDPNSGTYGQQVIEDPGQVCASHSGSTINGVPTCD